MDGRGSHAPPVGIAIRQSSLASIAITGHLLSSAGLSASDSSKTSRGQAHKTGSNIEGGIQDM